MDRIERSEEKYRQLFGQDTLAVAATDPEFWDILQRFVFGEVFYDGPLDDRKRELITLVVLTTNQNLPQLRVHVGAALQTGLAPEAIREAVYQCAPYLGFPKVLNAVAEMNEAFRTRGIELPLAPQARVEEGDRFEKGLAVQMEIFGDAIRKSLDEAPAEQKPIREYLSAFCFGDFYTRGGLELKTRELLTFCIVSALGGAESQVRAHVRGNLRMGNSRETLMAALTHCLPYMGFPRTLNALACVTETEGG